MPSPASPIVLTVAFAFLAPTILGSQEEPPKAEGLILETFKEAARSQKSNGRWKAPKRTPEKMTDEGVTGLAILTYVGGGHTHRHGKYRKNIAKAIDFLRKKVDEKGRLKGSFPNQALVTHAIAEVYTVSRDEDLKEIAQRIVDGLLDRQNDDGSFGGGQCGAVFQTALGLLALRAAKVGGLQVGSGKMRAAGEALAAQIDRESMKPKGDPSPLERSGSLAAVFLGRLLSGVRKSEEFQVALAGIFQEGDYPPMNAREAYLMTYALFQQGGEPWKDLIRGQDEWMNSRKRSKDLVGRLFETLALETRFRWERAQKGSGGP